MIEHWVGHDKFMAAIRDYLSGARVGQRRRRRVHCVTSTEPRRAGGGRDAVVRRSAGRADRDGGGALRRRRGQGDAVAEALLQRRRSGFAVAVEGAGVLEVAGRHELHAARRAAEGGDAAELPDVARGQRRRGRLLPRALRRGVAGGVEAGVRQRADDQGAHAPGRRRRVGGGAGDAAARRRARAHADLPRR